jgi:hypothetical protein
VQITSTVALKFVSCDNSCYITKEALTIVNIVTFHISVKAQNKNNKSNSEILLDYQFAQCQNDNIVLTGVFYDGIYFTVSRQ